MTTREVELIGKLRLIAKDCHWQLLEDAADTIDELRRDAARYRWLRLRPDWFDWDIVVQPSLPIDHPAHDNEALKIDCALDFVMCVFNEAIDAAIKESK